MKHLKVPLLVLLLNLVTHSVYCNLLVIHVQSSGVDRMECLRAHKTNESHQPSMHCQSLEFVAEQLGNSSKNITIVIESEICMKASIHFTYWKYLTIKGKNSHATINCNCNTVTTEIAENTVGLTFYQNDHLTISNVTITNCCGGVDNMYAAVQLIKCSNIAIEGVLIRKSKQSSALVVVNAFAQIIVNNCIFSTNIREYQTESSSSYAGGIHMQFADDSPSNVSITNCMFLNNISPFVPFDPKLAKMTAWNGNSLGGGMGIVFTQQSTGVRIYATNCTFSNNSASWGGGLSIHFQGNPSNIMITITDSVFSNNTGRIGGGGIQLSMPEMQAVDIKVSILFQNITFECNYARFGGGISVSAYYSNFTSFPGLNTKVYKLCMVRE